MEEHKDNRLKQLLIEISQELHQAIKIRAATRNVTMRTWVIRAIAKAIKNEEQYE